MNLATKKWIPMSWSLPVVEEFYHWVEREDLTSPIRVFKWKRVKVNEDIISLFVKEMDSFDQESYPWQSQAYIGMRVSIWQITSKDELGKPPGSDGINITVWHHR